MSRLLLVDDNPSIHRIAESLLAPTDIELVCVDSAAEALDRFGRGGSAIIACTSTAISISWVTARAARAAGIGRAESHVMGRP